MKGLKKIKSWLKPGFNRSSLYTFALAFIVVVIGASSFFTVHAVWKILSTPGGQALVRATSGCPRCSSKPEFKLKEWQVLTGETFSKIAGSLGLSPDKIFEITEGTKDVYDLAKIRAGNTLRAFFDFETDEFEKLEYRIDDENLLIIEDSEEGIQAEKVPIEYDIELAKTSGVIESSLYQAAKSLGLEDGLIMELADIFAWDIDFAFDIRKGDEFSFMYEKRFLDSQPAGTGKILAAFSWIQGEEHWAIYYQDPDGKEDYYDLEGKSLRRQFLRSPLQYRYISSGYSLRRLHPIWGIYTSHRAIDYAAPCGTPVVSSGAGTVTFAGWQNNIFGKTVVIRHGGIYTTRYSHLSSYAKGIKYGASVSQGQVIGFVGTTGTSTGCHLDYEMQKYGTPVNPLTYKFPKVEPVKGEYLEDFNLKKGEVLKKFNAF